MGDTKLMYIQGDNFYRKNIGRHKVVMLTLAMQLFLAVEVYSHRFAVPVQIIVTLCHI